MPDLLSSTQHNPVLLRKTFTLVLCVSLISAHSYHLTIERDLSDIWDLTALSLHCIGIALNIVVIIGLALRRPHIVLCWNM